MGRGSLLAGRLHLVLVPVGGICICNPVKDDEGSSTAAVDDEVDGNTAANDERRELS